jgi:hypothetical protein
MKEQKRGKEEVPLILPFTQLENRILRALEERV